MNAALLVAYAAGGLVLALWPLALRRTTALAPGSSSSRMLVVAGIVLGLIAGLTLPWWRREAGAQALSLREMGWGIALAALAVWVMGRETGRAANRSVLRLQTAAFAAAIAFLSLTTLALAHPDVQRIAWHHWGAYIGPVELMLAGAQMYRDFPPQYGLGPTLFIAAGCAATCWTWMYAVAAATTLAFSACVAWLALKLAKPLPALQREAVLLLCVVCCLVWTAYPPLLGTAIATPSVTGLRFLPALALAALLVQLDREDRPFPVLAGHAAWAFASLWSIESAFYATCVWWPFFLLLRGWRGTWTLAAWGAGLVALFVAGNWIAYGSGPTLTGVLAYIIDPPGRLPMNPWGAVWFAVAAMAAGIAANVRDFRLLGNGPQARRGLVVLLLAYATLSYFLGRSHDNNILNLFPFLLLVLLHAWTRSGSLPRALAIGLMACMLGWLPAANWAPWQGALPANAFDANWFRQVLPSDDPARNAFPPETQAVIARAQGLARDPVTVFGPYANPSSPAVDAVWSAVHAPGNLVTLSSPLRREFLGRTAKTLKRSGWLIVHTSLAPGAALIADYDSVYERKAQFDMNGYTAIHYAPRP